GSATAPPGASGVAPNADLVFVHLASDVVAADGDLGDSVRLLEALDFVRAVAGERPFVVNQSLGRTAGSHSGTSPVEIAIDHLIEETHCAVVNSAGNYFLKRLSAHGVVRPGGSERLAWEISSDDPSENSLSVYYGERDIFAVEILPPGATTPHLLELTDRTTLMHS